MSSEYSGGNSSSDSDKNTRPLPSEVWGPWELDDEETQPGQVVSPSSTPGSVDGGQSGSEAAVPPFDVEGPYREHVTGGLADHPAEAPLFRPAYGPYPPFQGYPAAGGGNGLQQFVSPHYAPPQAQQGYFPQGGPASYPAYSGYPMYPQYPGYPPYGGYAGYPGYPPYVWQPPKPKRDGYLFGVAIASLVGSILTILAGLGCLWFLVIIALLPYDKTFGSTMSNSEYFASIAFLIAFAVAGLVGGAFGLYHSIRSVFLGKPSARFWLPPFWIFVVLYLLVLGVGLLLHTRKEDVTFPALTMILVLLTGLFPALAVLALGVRRLGFPTNWRRFTLAIVSGATLAILLASILEFFFQFLIVRGQSANILLCIDRPDMPNCQSSTVQDLLLVIVAVMAPLVEEMVKPLAVVVLIGRVRSAAEAFVLGLACGIGFDLIETTGYISAGYSDWLGTAVLRTSAALLHGFGAAMVALGWYYLVKGKRYRWLLVIACWIYAVLQHALWNGSWGVTLLPAPIGPALDSWNVNLGFTTLPFYLVLNFVEAVFMFAFFVYITGKLRTKTPPPSSKVEGRDVQRTEGQRMAVPT